MVLRFLANLIQRSLYTRAKRRMKTFDDEDIPKETLKHLRVDSSVAEIPDEAFKDCGTLVHVQFQETLTRIGSYAFRGCDELKYFQFVSNGSSRRLETLSNNLLLDLEDGLLEFPESAKLQIDRYAFFECFGIRKVIVGSVFTKLEEGVFRSCRRLISAELPEGLQVIEKLLFAGCTSLKTVNIPSSVIKIGDFAFFFCLSLASFELPHGLQDIGKGSFSDCQSIETLHIPSTVSTIGQSAFEACKELKHIKLPPNLERIEDFMFYKCLLLGYIEIPTTVTFIGRLAFRMCHYLSHIRVPTSVETIAHDSFLGCNHLISIELPEEIVIGDLRNTDDEVTSFGGTSKLVSLAIPTLPENDTVVSDSLYNKSRLRRVVDDAADLRYKLKHRFDNAPLNKLCYYQSYHSPEDAVVQLRSLMEDDPLAATSQVDEFGMTPLHVLSLSQTPNVDMLVALMNNKDRADHMVHSRDSFWSTPLDYLCLNRMPNSTEVIRRVLQTRFAYWLEGSGSKKGSSQSDTMRQAVNQALAADWSSRRREIGRVYFELAKYEHRMELLSLVELCLWKIKIDEASFEEQSVNRESYRISSGAPIVLTGVLPFLDRLDQEEDCVPPPRFVLRFPQDQEGSVQAL
eukprot:scaffold5221_cov88-Cylindrotheca_fusiformis.AAC.6